MKQNCRIGKIKYFGTEIESKGFLERHLDRQALGVAHSSKGSFVELQKICKIISIYKKANKI